MHIYRPLRLSLFIVSMSLLVWAWNPQVFGAVGYVSHSFRPVSPEELKMTSEPAAPGAPAIILYREVYRDDSGQPPTKMTTFESKS